MSRVEHLGEGVTLLLGDCRELMAAIPVPAALISDPPYGIDYGNSGGFSASHGWGPWRENVAWDSARPEPEWLQQLATMAPIVCLWGGNYFADCLPPSMGWLVWDKGQREFSLADVELAWTNQQRAARAITYGRGAAVKDGKEHPTQKPVAVMQWCIEKLRVPAGSAILDPYLGSGTTGVAAVRMGHAFTGIEIEPRYFDTACRRISAELARPRLPLPEPVAKPVQTDMLDYSAAQHQPLFEVGS